MAKGYLNGIDVSSNQPEDICSRVPYDFAIVKVGGNPNRDCKGRYLKWNYVNPYLQKQVEEAYAQSQCVGLYWFCYGKTDANEEADFFVEQVAKLGMLKRAILVADYEADAVKKGRDWLRKFCKRVEAKAGYSPMIYASGSIIKEQNLGSLGYQIWCANYYLGDKPVKGYDTTGMKLYYAGAKMWQYTEYGYLKGYSGKLDFDRFFGSKEEWKILAGGKAPDKEKTPSTIEGVRYRITASSLNVRSKRSTISGKIVGTLKRDSLVYLKDVKKNAAGNYWGMITSGTYKGKYIAVIFKGNVYAKKG